METKFPKSYKEEKPFDPKELTKPQFLFDSKGRMIMPYSPYQKAMLSTLPGSKNVLAGTEDSASKPTGDPAAIKSGYLHAESQIKCGPKGGWVVALGGGDFEKPIQYGNETTGELKFYVDKEGDVYLKGKIIAEEGGIIAGWTIGAEELFAGEGVSKVGMRPGTWPFYAGNDNPAIAPYRVNPAGQIWVSQLNIEGGSGIANLSDAGALATKDAVDLSTEEVLNKYLDNISDGVDYGRVKLTALNEDSLILIDQIIDGTFKKVKAVALTAEGMVLIDELVEGTYGRILKASLDPTGLVLLDEIKEGTFGRVLKASLDTTGLVLLDETKEGTYGRVLKASLNTSGLVLLDETVEGDYSRVKSTSLDTSGLVLLDKTKEGTYGRILKTSLDTAGLVLLDVVKEGIYAKVKAASLSTEGLILLDETIEGTYGLVKKASLSTEGLVLMDNIEDGIYSKVLNTQIQSGLIHLSASCSYASGYNPSDKESLIQRSTSAPTDKTKLWLDLNYIPNLLKRWSGSSWIKATPRDLSEIEDSLYRKAVSADEKTGASRAYSGLDPDAYIKKVIVGNRLVSGSLQSGLNINPYYMGYYNGSTWSVFIKSDGKFKFNIGSNNYIDGGITESGVVTIRGKLNADDLKAGIITGRTIKTSGGNTRVEMSADGPYINKIVFYYGGTEAGTMSNFTGQLCLQGPAGAGSGLSLRVGDYLGLELTDTLPGAPQIESISINPLSDGAYDLGKYTSPAKRWKNLNLSGYINMGYYLYSYQYLMFTFNGYGNKILCGKSLGLVQRSSHPGSASAYNGYMYWNTIQQDIVFSNGYQWHKVDATPIP